MRVIKKRNKKAIMLSVLAGILALLIAGAIITDALIGSDANGQGGTNDTPAPEIIEGLEDVYNKSAVAYTHVPEASIELIRVKGDSEYLLWRGVREETKEGEEPADRPFMFYYFDANGDMQMYYPDICDSDPTFDYEDLYALESNDTFGKIPKLTYLCTAIGTTYFSERIELPENETDREKMLSLYGLSEEDSPVRVDFTYINKGGAEQTRTLRIGDRNITGAGYYFMVDDRNYVYSNENNYFNYAFLEFADYVSPILTAAGLAQDNAFEPYLTTDFRQWKNVLYDYDKDGNPEIVKAGSKVILQAVTYTATRGTTYADGYIVESERGVTLDLAELEKAGKYEGIINQIVGKSVGTFSAPIKLTFPTYSSYITMNDEGKSEKYTYTISRIESAITDGVENSAEGTAVGSAVTELKVTYDFSIGGEKQNQFPLHAVIDMNAASIAGVKDQLCAQNVGYLDTPITFNVVYDTENTTQRHVTIIISEVTKVINSEDFEVDKADSGCRAMYRYRVVVDGVESEAEYTDTVTVDIAATDPFIKSVSEAIIGKSVGEKLEKKVDGYTFYSEPFGDFISYSVSGINYFVTSENIVSFRFEQASDRDAYYGESLYANTMSGKYAIYALNASACEAVVRVFGGLDVNASASMGLVGTETVAVGITPEIMKKYGLYANTVYFELPRGITSVIYDGTDMDEYLSSLDDYTYYSTLGFTLYISDVQPDGSRYVASDMYDVVSKVDGKDFVFLDMSFVDFYARRNLILTDISDINNITLDFYMEDIYGSYSNKLEHNELYAYNGKLTTKDKLTESELSYATKYDGIQVYVTPSGDCIDTKFSAFLEEKGYDFASLYEFYGKKYDGLDTLGTSNFKEFIELLFYTYYADNFAEGDDKEGELLMKMSVELYEGYSSYNYVYEFHRVEDRRIMVKLYREERKTGEKIQEVSDFYVSTFAFKKMVYAYMGILNGDTINSEIAYPEG